MAIFKMVRSSGERKVKSILNYVLRDGEIEDFQTFECDSFSAEQASDLMEYTKRAYGKTDGRQYYHMMLSFTENEIDDDTLNEIAKEFLELDQFQGFERIAVNHHDTDNPHIHIVMNSVSIETGMKYEDSRKQMFNGHRHFEKIVKSHGLEYTPLKNQKENDFYLVDEEEATKGSDLKIDYTGDPHFMAYMEMAKRGETPWKEQVAMAIQLTRNLKPKSTEEFKDYLEQLNIKAIIDDNRKYMTFQDLNATTKKNKVRDRILNKNYKLNINKTILTEEFENNKKSHTPKRMDLDYIMLNSRYQKKHESAWEEFAKTRIPNFKPKKVEKNTKPEKPKEKPKKIQNKLKIDYNKIFQKSEIDYEQTEDIENEIENEIEEEIKKQELKEKEKRRIERELNEEIQEKIDTGEIETTKPKEPIAKPKTRPNYSSQQKGIDKRTSRLLQMAEEMEEKASDYSFDPDFYR